MSARLKPFVAMIWLSLAMLVPLAAASPPVYVGVFGDRDSIISQCAAQGRDLASFVDAYQRNLIVEVALAYKTSTQPSAVPVAMIGLNRINTASTATANVKFSDGNRSTWRPPYSQSNANGFTHAGLILDASWPTATADETGYLIFLNPTISYIGICGQQNPGGVRLSHGLYGRLEIIKSGKFSTVCNDITNLDGVTEGSNVAQVVCRQMGFGLDSGAYLQSSGVIGLQDGFEANVPIGFDTNPAQATCTGTEAQLLDCPGVSTTVGCTSHNTDIGATCSRLDYNDLPANGNVFLSTIASAKHGSFGNRYYEDQTDKALYTVEDLGRSGLFAGTKIRQLAVFIGQKPDRDLELVHIGYKLLPGSTTTLTKCDEAWWRDIKNVLYRGSQVELELMDFGQAATGWYWFQLDEPIEWDGTSTMVIELASFSSNFGSNQGGISNKQLGVTGRHYRFYSDSNCRFTSGQTWNALGGVGCGAACPNAADNDGDNDVPWLRLGLDRDVTVTTLEPLSSTSYSGTQYFWQYFKVQLTAEYTSFTAQLTNTGATGDISVFVRSAATDDGILPNWNSFTSSATASAGVAQDLALDPQPAYYYIGVWSDNSNGFNLDLSVPPPALTTVFAQAGFRTAGGVAITLAGSNFGSGGVLQIQDAVVVIDSQTPTEIIATVPEGQGQIFIEYISTEGQSTGRLTGAGVAYVAPTIQSVNPTSGGTGTEESIVITGTDLGISPIVKIGTSVATIIARTHESITFALPKGEGTGYTLEVDVGGQIATDTFSYTGPRIDGAGPALPSAGGEITLTGSNFGTPGSQTVTVGGADCPVTFPSTDVESPLHTEVRCTLPAGSGSNQALIITVAGQTFTSTYSFETATIDGFSANSYNTDGNVPLTITGQGFGTAGPLSFSINLVDCPIIAGTRTDASVQCTLPAGQGQNVPLVGSKNGGPTNTLPFSYSTAVITGVLSTTYPTGGDVLITINGESFGITPTARVNDVTCPLETVTAHVQIICRLPKGLGTNIPVVVTQGSEPSEPFLIAYDPPEVAATGGLQPTTLPVEGGTLVINGKNFGDSALSTVTLNGKNLVVSSFQHQVITAQVPSGSGQNLPVVVTTVDGRSTDGQDFFSYIPASLISVTPNSGPTEGGIDITVKGSNFDPEGVVTFDGVECGRQPGSSSDEIICDMPEGFGSVPVVFTSGGVSTPESVTFNYIDPSISQLEPRLPSGETIGGYALTIRGSSFDQSAQGTVTVGGVDCPVLTYTHTVITCTMPPGQGSVSVQVTTANIAQSSAQTYTYAPPTVSTPPGVASTDGSGVITILGNSFGSPSSGGSTVTFSSTGDACIVTTNSHRTLVCTVPVGVGTNLPLEIRTSGQTTMTTFSYTPPVISGYTTTGKSSAGGDLVTVNGSNFGLSPSVKIGPNFCSPTPTPATHARYICESPAGSNTNLLILTAGGQQSNSQPWAYDVPTINSVSPLLGQTDGGVLTIVGAALGNTGTVTVGANACSPITSYNATTIVCQLPVGQGTNKNVVVTTGGKDSNAFPFSYAPPSIATVNPTSAPTGGQVTVLTLTGESFGLGGSVTVGSATCSPTGAGYDHRLIECTLPVGEGVDKDVSVFVGGQTGTKVDAFSYSAPNILSVSSPQGAPTSGGPLITITGTSFSISGSVTVGGQPCSNLGGTWTHDRITCKLPAGQGAARVIVSAGEQDSADNANDDLIYDAPVVTSALLPGSASTSVTRGGATLTIKGSNFGSVGTMAVGPYDCPKVAYSQTEILCTMPAGVGEDLPVTVTVSGLTNAATATLSYIAPKITSFTSTGPTDGSITVIVGGTNFGPAGSATIDFGGSPVVVTQTTHEQASFPLPAGTGVGKSITMVVGGQAATNSAVPATFRYEEPTVTKVAGCALDQTTSTSGCDIAGGDAIVITGTNFGTGTPTVKIAGVACLNPTATSHVRIDCTLDETAAGGLDEDVVVTVDTQSGSAALLSFSVPSFVAGTLQPAAGPACGTATCDVAASQGLRIDIQVVDFGTPPTAANVKFGTTGVYNTSQFTCGNVGFRQDGGDYFLQCDLPAGVGRDLQLVAEVGLQMSAPSEDTATYTRPSIIDGTIRPSVGAPVSDEYTGQSSEGDLIVLDVNDVGTDASLISVQFGPSGATDRICGNVKIVGTMPTSIQCKTPPGEGSNLVFVVFALNHDSPEGNRNSYNYVQAPIVTSVFGCDENTATETSNCPTEGGSLITVSGQFFSPVSLTVKIGASYATEVAYVNPNTITARTPPGAGFDQPVLVTVASQFSRIKNLVSYSLPVVTAVSGCTPDGATTIDCPREGGIPLVLTGTNFGPSDALVLVGGSACEPVVHTAGNEHQEVTCTLPAGVSVQSGVLFVQGGGEAASNLPQISYLQCAPGNFSNYETACSQCPEGSFSDVSGAVSCTQCSSGRYTDTKGNSECLMCPKGKSSQRGADGSGPTECEPCGEGQFVASEGSTVCNPCTAGRYAEGTGNQACLACDPGKFSASAAATCTNCTIGTSLATSGGTECVGCPPGRIASEEGQQTCTECDAGRYSPNTGGIVCLACPKGKSQPSSGSADCVPCVSGSANNDTAQLTCKKCDAGSFSAIVGGVGAEECTPCPPGEFASQKGQQSCQQCNKGRFSSEEGAAICEPCDPGFASGILGASSCVACARGFFATAAGSVQCSSCPSGSFSDQLNSTACTLCSAGKYQPFGEQQACLPCDPGTAVATKGQATCFACESGSFAEDPESETCARCPPGTFSRQTGTALTECTNCTAGTFSDSEGQDSCSPCPLGSFGSADAATGCTLCPPGKFTDEPGLTECKNCTAGTVSAAAGALGCVSCRAGRYAPTDGLTACTDCLKGTAQGASGQVSCIDCPAGKYTTTDRAGQCLSCPPGSFSNSSNSDFCYTCDPGQVQPQAGRQSCNACGPGEFVALPGQASCSDCPAGQANSEDGATECVPCDPGKFSSVARSTECLNCTLGSFSDENGAVQCTGCPIGKFADAPGATLCQDCQEGSVQPDPGLSSCVSCVAGSYQPDDAKGSCILCPVGRVSNDSDASSCTKCPAGKFAQTPGSTVCTECPIGSYGSLDEASSCRLCEPGSFSNDTGLQECYKCDAGESQGLSGQSSCSPCAEGFASNLLGASQCSPCGSGSFANETGTLACSRCPAGRFSVRLGQQGPVECTLCRPGTFQNAESQASCLPCAAGYISVGSGAQACTPCLAGTIAATQGQSQCLNCTAGTFTSVSASTQCSPCPPGSFAEAKGSSECEMCDTGKAQPSSGALSCSVCPAGRFIDKPGQASCVDCQVGRYAPLPSSTDCLQCPVGRFSDLAAATSCKSCSVGKYSSRLGASECQFCNPGTATNVLETEFCEPCEPGFAAGSSGAFFCTPCVEGSFSQGSSALTCSPCQPGFFVDQANATECIRCPEGRYSGLPGAIECDVCEVGRFNDLLGQTDCAACPPGKYSNVNESQSCISCDTGTFQDVSGQSECKDCLAGTFSDGQGARQCTQCDPGTATNETGSLSCEQCVAGRFQDEFGQSECKDCPGGRFQQAVGRTQCSLCAPGRAHNDTGRIDCPSCLQGTFQDESGKLECRDCPRGRYTNVLNTRSCFLCEAGRAINSFGGQQCEDCAPGSFQDSPGQFVCSPCEPGTYTSATGRSECLQCDSGKSQAEPGQDACDVCSPGKFQNARGAATCSLCPTGRFSASEADTCNPCEPGFYAPNNGTVQCQVCPSGTFQTESGQAVCDPCPPGTDSPTGARSCNKCSAQTIAPNRGTPLCIGCPDGAEANQERTDCECAVGEFQQPSNSSSSNSTVEIVCVECPDGALCDRQGVRRDNIGTEDNWWRENNDTLEYYRCQIGNCRDGGCAPNREGPICAFCSPGFEAPGGVGACQACPSPGAATVFSTLIVLAVVGVLFFMYWIILRNDRQLAEASKIAYTMQSRASVGSIGSISGNDSSNTDRASRASHGRARGISRSRASLGGSLGNGSLGGGSTDIKVDEYYNRGTRSLDEAGALHSAPNVTFKMKIVLGFLQIVSNLSFAQEVPWPTYYNDFIQVFKFANFDFLSWANVGCVVKTDFFLKWIVAILVPPILFGLLVLFYVLPSYIMDKRDMSDNDEYRARRATSRRKFWKLVIFTIFLIYPSVSKTIMSMYVCTTVGPDTFLLADFTIQCYTDRWYTYAYANIVAILVYPVGIPLVFYLIMRKNRARLGSPSIRLQLGFLYDAFNADLWWFEMADMMNKLFLTSLLGFFSLSYQIPIGLIWCIGYTLILLLQRPYVRKGDDRLQLFGQMELFLLMMAGHVIFESGKSELGLTVDIILSIVLISLTLMFILFFFAQAIKASRKIVTKMHRKRRRKRNEAADANLSDDEDDVDAFGQKRSSHLDRSFASGESAPDTAGRRVRNLMGVQEEQEDDAMEDDDGFQNFAE